MQLDRLALAVHVVAGGVAVVTFWLPWLVKKGGALHRRVGFVFTGAMAVVAVTGLLVSLLRLLDANPRNDAPALFLGAVGLLAGASASLGVRAIRTKRREAANRNGWDLSTAALLGLAGVGTLALAARESSLLFAVFGLLCTANAFGQLRFWLRPPEGRTAYLLQHIGGMGTACIATVTAFLVVNAPRLGIDGRTSLVLWIAPGVLGGVGISLWQARYRRTSARGRGVAPDATALASAQPSRGPVA